MELMKQEFGNSGLTKYQVFIKDPVDRAVEELFETVVEDFHVTSGDIAPEQYFAVEEIKEKLSKILETFVVQNQ
jgi:hypothetical protein